MLTVFITAILCIGIDQLTKYLVVSNFAVGESIGLIDGVFHFTYIKNEGAAFGSLSDYRWIFMSASILLIIGIIVYSVWKRPKNIFLCLSLGMLLGGGVGNMIDRIFLGYVVDFLDFCAFPELWKWIFNFADAFVCVGTALLIFWMFKYDTKTYDAEKTAEKTDGAESVKGGNENDEAE
ncbi:MAG: signal peptidase II [Ruminococcaceae bacterium]|nr:signal peptidase II [Oscillospiraceae bacterium]